MAEFEVEKIYFDMDGVLANFLKGVKEMCNFTPLPINAPDTPENKAHDNLMWSKIREVEHFYDKLELMPGAAEMFHAVYDRYGSRCEILTGVPKPHRHIDSAGEDKQIWMHRLLANDIKVNIVERQNKYLFCRNRGSILIDDMKDNILSWESAGGTGIVHVSPEETLAQLKRTGIL